MSYELICGDVLDVLPSLPANGVHCVVTSPPYWGLRDYGVDGQIGLEESPECYVEKLVRVFREVRRVLHPSGTVWCNLGDSYAANRSYQVIDGKWRDVGNNAPSSVPVGLKPKDLCLIPWRVAIALQDDGWWVRSIICWQKKSCMPESVTDRPTNSWEPIFLLAKSQHYFYDAEAIREGDSGQTGAAADFKRNTKDHLIPGQSAMQHRTDRESTQSSGTRNSRNVWSLGPEPYSEAHFATFPTEIPRRAIKAGSSAKGCCPKCLEPWVRVVEHITGAAQAHKRPKRTAGMDSSTSTLSMSGNGSKEWAERGAKRIAVGWQPGCTCNAGDPIPCTILDPFNGSGTSGFVAVEQGRNYIGIDLNPAYIALAQKRIGKAAHQPLMFEELL